MLWYNSLGPVPAASSSGGDSVNVAGLVEGAAPGAAMDGTEPVYGNPSAPYTVLEWADFECPHCGIVAPQLKELVNEHPEIRVAFRNYPLDMACNPNIQREFHKNSCTAAYAAECAQQQGKFWELTGLMFKNQSYLDRSGIETMAEQKQLDVPTLLACMDDPATKAAVKGDLEAGESAGVTGTPALFLLGAHGDGTWVKLGLHPTRIPAIIEAHKAAGAPLPVGAESVVSGDRWAQIWVDLPQRPSQPSRLRRSTPAVWAHRKTCQTGWPPSSASPGMPDLPRPPRPRTAPVVVR